jgi:hypothetical protein
VSGTGPASSTRMLMFHNGCAQSARHPTETAAVLPPAPALLLPPLQNLVTLILHPNGSEADDTCCTPEGAEGSTAITEVSVTVCDRASVSV